MLAVLCINNERTMILTWADRIANLTAALGRQPTLREILEAGQLYQMTPDEVEAQRRSCVRCMSARFEHGMADFEQCPNCRQIQ